MHVLFSPCNYGISSATLKNQIDLDAHLVFTNEIIFFLHFHGFSMHNLDDKKANTINQKHLIANRINVLLVENLNFLIFKITFEGKQNKLETSIQNISVITFLPNEFP